MFDILRHELPWEQKSIVIGGVSKAEKRKTCLLADDASVSYEYSGRRSNAHHWPPDVCAIKAAIEDQMKLEGFG
eukprot:4853158-Karenia_brevis.AAC.1